MDIQQSWRNWRKKILFTHFLPLVAKEEEEVNSKPTEELVEKGPVLIYDFNNPWKIKKRITHEDLNQRRVVISFYEMFEYILPYMMLDKANKLVKGSCVRVWDVTNASRKPEFEDLDIKKLDYNDYSLVIERLFNVHRLGIDDEIGLCWNPIMQAFLFKLLLKVLRKKTFSYNFIPEVTRELIETDPAPAIDLNYISRKKITHENLIFGELQISFSETFEHILPYWKLELARRLLDGKVARAGNYTFRKLPNDDYALSIMRLFNEHGLGVGDELGLHWDPELQMFIFNILSN